MQLNKEQIQKLAEEKYPTNGIDGISVKSVVNRQREIFIEGYTTCQSTEVATVRQKTLEECISILMSQLQPSVYQNGYPIEAIPKTALLELPAMMKLKGGQADKVAELQKELERVKGLLEDIYKQHAALPLIKDLKWENFKRKNNL